jgi:hypothetical protein
MLPILRDSYTRGAFSSPIGKNHAIALIGYQIFYAILLVKSVDQLLWGKGYPQMALIVSDTVAFVSLGTPERALLGLYLQLRL